MKKILLTSTVCAGLVFGAEVLPVEKRTFEQSKFIPDISLVMDASYVSRSVVNDEVAHLEVPGVAHGLLGSHTHDGATHATYNADKGFNLNYAELVLSSSVDPFFNMDGVFHFSPNGVEVEELYFTSHLDYGLRFKGGKFNSNFGYLNEQHHHAWDFADMALVYESFLGMHGINEKGAQLQWIVPAPHYLMFGVEALQGENEQMFGNATIGDVEAPIAQGAEAPSLFVGYAKASFDISDTTFFMGGSFARGASRIDHTTDEEPHAFSGMSSLYGADLVVLHSFDSYSSLKWQSEWLMRDMDGKKYNLDPNDTTVVLSSPNMQKKQAGLYSQLIYAYDKNWKGGVRFDTIYKNEVLANGIDKDMPTNLNKYSAMIEYHTSEFARFRLQYNRNSALYNEDGNKQNIDTIILQANISIGAHGAHSF